MKKLAFVLIAALMITCLSACGSSEGSADGGAAEPEVHETTKYGNINLYVPEGYTVTQGSILDENDQNAVRITKEGEYMTYFNITVSEESEIDDSISMTKEINAEYSPTDLNLSYDNGSFAGIEYDSMGYHVTLLKGTLANCFVNVGSCGFDVEGEDFINILSSISVAQ